MHAFLIIGRDLAIQQKVNELSDNLKLKQLNYEIKKIEDVRSLNKLISLTLEEPTAIIIKDVSGATDEALNAFLKNLEEPQANLYFILTSRNEQSVLSTIVSRCQIIRVVNNSDGVGQDSKINDFIGLSTPEKLQYVDQMRKRDETVSFLEDCVFSYHQRLHGDKDNYRLLAKYLTILSQTLKRVRGNGNINLQLTNMVLGLV
jgi:hypothetical protein